MRKIVKSFVLLIGLIFCCKQGKAQAENRFPLSDAIAFVQKIKEGKVAKALDIYDVYTPAATNSFIEKPILPEGAIRVATETFINEVTIQNDGGTGLGAPLINALSTVIAKRFKEELTLAFLENFREKLKIEPYLGAMFPNAKLVLLNEDVFNINLWLTSFRGALDEDLKALPNNITFLLKAVQENAGLNEEQKNTLDLMISLYEPSLNFATNPTESYQGILGMMDALQGINFKDNHVKPILTFFYPIIKELGNGTYEDWIDERALKNIRDPRIAKAFIGFTIEKYKTTLQAQTVINGGIPINVYDYLTGDNFNKVKIDETVQFLNSVTTSIKGIYKVINQLKNKQRTFKLNFEDYGGIINKSIETFQLILDEKWFSIFNSTPKNPEKIQNIIKGVEEVNTYATAIYGNINAKEYSKIFLNTVLFTKKYIPENKLEGSKTFAEFTRYANFAISLSSATSSEEMATVIEAAALPVQSYRLKRNSRFSISLNSYAGVFFASEQLNNSNAKNKTSGLIGVTAPVGIGFNWGLTTKDENDYSKYPSKTTVKKGGGKIEKSSYYKGHSLSLFTSLVDVGALATFRLNDDQTPVDELEWQNVLAPGAHIIWGIGKTPLSLGVGAQYGPELRKVTAKEGVATTTINSRGWRFGVSFIVDIPLLQLYRKTDKIVKE